MSVNWSYSSRSSRVAFLFIGVLIIWIGLLSVVSGFKDVERSGTCFREMSVCHGIPGESCIGIETTVLEVDQSCEYKGQIKTMCRKVRERSCQNSSDADRVMGQDCDFWREAMDMEERSCSEVS